MEIQQQQERGEWQKKRMQRRKHHLFTVSKVHFKLQLEIYENRYMNSYMKRYSDVTI